MKCSRCGKSFKDIKGIAAHYRKSHPGAMKARKPRKQGRDFPVGKQLLKKRMQQLRNEGWSEREVMNAYYGE